MSALPLASQPVKFTLTHYRQPHRTHEEFVDWMVTRHIPLALPVFKKHGVIGYTLFITPPPANEELKKQLEGIRPAWKFADFDLFIEYIIPSVETITDVMSDPDWAVAVADQDDWIIVSESLVSVGHATAFVADGKVLSK